MTTELEEQLQAITPESILNEVAQIQEQAKKVKLGYLAAKKAKDLKSIDMILRRAPVVDLPDIIVKLTQAVYGSLYVVFHKIGEIDESIDHLERGVVESLDDDINEDDESDDDDDGEELSEEEVADITEGLRLSEVRLEKMRRILKFLKSLENSSVMTEDGKAGIELISSDILSLREDIDTISSNLAAAMGDAAPSLAEKVTEDLTGADGLPPELVTHARGEADLPPIPPEEFIGPVQPRSNSEDPVD